MSIFCSMYKKCKEHAHKNGVSSLAVFFDYIYARFHYGFCGEDYFLNTSGYAMKNFQKKDVFTHKRWLDARKVFNDSSYTHILDNKVDALKYFNEFISHDWCYPKEHNEEQFNQFINRYNRIICKPVSAEGGSGIAMYCKTGGFGGYSELRDKNVLLEECVVQHPLMSFNNTSVNTVRVYTVLDRFGNVHILKAILRAGVGDSIVDNFHSGGVIYPVNVEHGFIESYGERRCDKNGVMIHPGTDIIMLGFQIPHWDRLKDTVVKMALLLPQVRYVGWDMVITPEGVDCIEANDNADHALFCRVGNERLFWNKIKSLM